MVGRGRSFSAQSVTAPDQRLDRIRYRCCRWPSYSISCCWPDICPPPPHRQTSSGYVRMRTIRLLCWLPAVTVSLSSRDILVPWFDPWVGTIWHSGSVHTAQLLGQCEPAPVLTTGRHGREPCRPLVTKVIDVDSGSRKNGSLTMVAFWNGWKLIILTTRPTKTFSDILPLINVL